MSSRLMDAAVAAYENGSARRGEVPLRAECAGDGAGRSNDGH
jgi:hypothetical protein